MSRKQSIETRLQEKLAPSFLKVEDDSAQHAGHAGARADGESHFSVWIVSEAFAGLTSVGRHRLVYEILKEDLRQGDIHALAIKAFTESEVEAKVSAQ